MVKNPLVTSWPTRACPQAVEPAEEPYGSDSPFWLGNKGDDHFVDARRPFPRPLDGFQHRSNGVEGWVAEEHKMPGVQPIVGGRGSVGEGGTGLSQDVTVQCGQTRVST